ncbi:MAG: LuxR family transcriptional regulator [Bryobacterales bacterium]|nr:LuxR family transcriptional regulator [Bryobacterales bacterium]
MTQSPVKKKILVCDTQPVAVEGVRWLLKGAPDLEFAGAVYSLEAAFELVRGMRPAVIVIDKGFGTVPLVDWLHQLAASGTGCVPVIWGSNVNESEALRLLQAGARGIMRRTAEPTALITCLNTVTAGTSWMEDGIFGSSDRLTKRSTGFTVREAQVAALVEKGFRNRDIAVSLGISTGTVKIHLKHIFEKAGVRGRYGLALTTLRKKGVDLPPLHSSGLPTM